MVERRGDRLYFVGRRGGVINVGGAKVHPEEVEAALNAHEAVRASRVFARKNPITGALVFADVVLRDQRLAHDAESEREILAACRARLAPHMVPAGLRFVADTADDRRRKARAAWIMSSSRAPAEASASRSPNGLRATGFRVVAVARRDSEALSATTRKLAEHGPGALVFRPLDLSDVAAIPTFVRELRRQFGPIYGLVNNAGLGTAGILANMPDAEIEALIRLNTLSPILMSKYVVRGMMAQGRGRVINVCSIVAFTGFNALSVYAATKASLVGFTKSLAREVGRVGVNVNAIAPGFIDTEMTGGLEGSERERVIGRSALRRLAAPEDVAAMAALLMGEGGRNITGAVMTVDAGGTA